MQYSILILGTKGAVNPLINCPFLIQRSDRAANRVQYLALLFAGSIFSIHLCPRPKERTAAASFGSYISPRFVFFTVMDTWIIYVIAPIAVALVSWILGKNSRRIDETAKIVTLLQDEIGRLTRKVEKLETKLEAKDDALEQKSRIIQEAFRCRTPSPDCPVLIRLAESNRRHFDSDAAAEATGGPPA